MKKRVVIAGMGDTGVLVAAHLSRGHEIIGISTKPALVSGQELGARLTKTARWKEDYLVGFERFIQLDNVEIIQGRVIKIDPEKNTVQVTTIDGVTKNLNYDILVIASGTRNGFWRNDALQAQETIDDALQEQSGKLAQAKTLAIVGAGPTGVSVASNTKEQFPDKDVHMFFKQDKILAGYPPKTRDFLTRRLQDQGISLHPAHHVEIPNTYPLPELEPGELTFTSGQHPFQATCILWVSGAIKPNSDFIPDEMLNEAGFVTVNPYLQSEIYDNIFAIGDIAASDPNRSSARNAGFKVVAKNIEKLLSGQHAKMRPFRAPKFRWGSIIGLQKEGMRIFTPQGGNVKVGPRSVKNILFPIFVRRLIYRGIRKKHLIERP